jgi:diguanylate cyclase (GGDEF)-like protein
MVGQATVADDLHYWGWGDCAGLRELSTRLFVRSSRCRCRPVHTYRLSILVRGQVLLGAVDDAVMVRLRRFGSRLRPRVGGKLFLAVGVLVPAVLAIAAVGALGLGRMAARTDVLYSHSLAVCQHSADVAAAAAAIHETSLYQVAVHDVHLNAELDAELDQVLIPRLTQTIMVLRHDYEDQPARQLTVDRITAGLGQYLKLRQTGAYGGVADHPRNEAAKTALASRTDRLLEPVVLSAERLRTDEALNAGQIKRESDATYLSTRVQLAVSAIVVLLLGLGIVLALIRNMVPRIRRYSQFAADVAAGRPTTALRPRGQDELAELGTALNDMVVKREVARQAEQALHERVALAEQAQAEFVDTLQVTRSEDEAQELLQRHLQRSLPSSSVAVLRINNSANRLQAATHLPPASELAGRLPGAEPRSCIAVRLGRTHREGTGRPPLLSCTLCGDRDGPSMCEPLLVGGEVIGSVLVVHPQAIADSDDAQIKNTVGQAAPVLANLRSLALAEFRANNDSLTGLPNKRATEDTVKRMVAQACRSFTPLTAVMLDLDHFKEINDLYGHAQGDEVLAAVGTVIQSSLRASDFAGRIGGEEFLILLPETGTDGAWLVTEKVRNAIAMITIPGVERAITASLGIAGLLEHAGNATGLLRAADAAQYAAKAAGRNCSVVAPEVLTTDAMADVPAQSTSLES